jgi:hypothetical protein
LRGAHPKSLESKMMLQQEMPSQWVSVWSCFGQPCFFLLVTTILKNLLA